MPRPIATLGGIHICPIRTGLVPYVGVPFLQGVFTVGGGPNTLVNAGATFSKTPVGGDMELSILSPKQNTISIYRKIKLVKEVA